MEPFEQLKKIMADKLKSPTVFFSAKDNDVLSGLALWRRAHDRRHELRDEGYKKGDLYFCEKPNGFEFLVDLVACIVGQYRFFPCHSLTPEEKQKSIKMAETNPEISVFLATGGTISRKIVGLSETVLIHQMEVHSKILNLKPEEPRLCTLPWTHSFGFVLDLLLGIYNQQTLIISRNSSAQEILKCVENYQIQHLACVPRVLEALRQRNQNTDLSQVQVHFGGAYLSKDTLDWGKTALKEIIEGYGLTEAGPGVLMDGRPAGCEVLLRPSKFNQLQELWVKTHYPCFWNNKITCEEGFFNTSDLAVQINDKILIKGRDSDLIKTTNGQWISRFDLNNEIKTALGSNYVDYDPVKQIVKTVVSNQNSYTHIDSQKKIKKILGFEIHIEIFQADNEFWKSVSESRKKSIEDHLKDLKVA